MFPVLQVGTLIEDRVQREQQPAEKELLHLRTAASQVKQIICL